MELSEVGRCRYGDINEVVKGVMKVTAVQFKGLKQILAQTGIYNSSKRCIT